MPPPSTAEEIDMVHTLLLMKEKHDANAELLPGLDGIENGIENGIVGKVILGGGMVTHPDTSTTTVVYALNTENIKPMTNLTGTTELCNG